MNLSPTPLKRILFFLFFDLIFFYLTLKLSYLLRFNFDIPINFTNDFIFIFIIISIMKISIFIYFRLYRTAWRYFSLNEVKKILLAHLIVYIVFATFILIQNDLFVFSRSIIIIDCFLSIIFITLLRLSKRIIIENNKKNNDKNTLVIGVDNSIMGLIQKNKEYSPVAIVDDNKMLVGTYISNIEVFNIKDIEYVVKTKSIEAVIFSTECEQDELLKYIDFFSNYEISDIKVAYSLENSKEQELKDISVEDLLARHPKDLDKSLIQSFISGKVVLITGAGGSIGSEISRQCNIFGAKQLILLDHSEFNLYQIYEELNSNNVITKMTSVLDVASFEEVFKDYSPEIVIHAAAYKHVPLVEDNILSGIKNNVLGTKNSIDLSIKYGVEKFVLISTDKAVRPTNVMGTTKRICELYAQNVISNQTEIVSVRFGNVLGSSGSVIPKFKKQIENGGPITVTHPDITRYFMLIPEACELVLQAASLGKGGEIFILDMGEPIKIVDLAKKMIDLSGHKNIEINYCGLRPGEKLYEELLINDSDKKTKYNSITVASQTVFDINLLNIKISELFDSHNILVVLKEIVPEFEHKTN